MTHELNALYYASLRGKCHAAFYRLPNEKSCSGFISNSLSDVTNDSEGFIINPFDQAQKPKLIPNQIEFKFDETLELNFPEQNNFTLDFQNHFDAWLKTPGSVLIPFSNLQGIHFSTQAEYISNIEKAQLEIGKGTFSKVVLARTSKYNYTNNRSVIDIFSDLCKAYPNAFVSLISSPFYGTWLGASPEILLDQDHENYSTVAIAGTKIASSKKSFTSKEFEEQNIIKEYIEIYLNSKNIKSISSKIQDINAGSLIHLKTNITFNHSSLERMEILQALHPTPAVGGYPKENALAFISENENYSREIYAGFIGPVSKNEMHVFVNIRCMQWFPQFAAIYAGAGITGASNAEAEWNETENKMQVIASVL